MEVILVSACLLDENCKYNGGNNYHEKIELLKKKYATSMLYPVHMNYHDLCEFVKANHFANVILNHHAGRINDMEHIALNVDTGKTIEF